MTVPTVNLLNWLARLPFLKVDDLALLTGSPAPDVETALRELARAGQVDSITPSSPEMASTRLYVLPEWARRQTATGKQVSLPLNARDSFRRLASLEATVALNVFAAGLVTASRRTADAGLDDLWTLPRSRSADAWWPPGVHAFGSFRIGTARAPFFVFVDRAGAPSAHRATLVAGWYRFREGHQPWGTGNVPPVLILCPGPAWEDAWSQHVLASADRRRLPPLRVLIATRAGLGDRPDGPHWRPADGSSRATLIERLGVKPAPTQYSPPHPLRLASCPSEPTDRATPLHRWAQETARDRRSASRLELFAALSLMTSELEKRLLDCLGRHPLLTDTELATVLQVQPRVATLALERALTNGLIATFGTTAPPHYCLTPTALGLLAARDEVPVRRYARHSSVTALPGAHGGRVPTLLHQFEHTVGSNSFFLGLLRGETPSTPRLISWLNAAESAVRFESAGMRHSMRPDGSGQVVAEGQVATFLLEWDRGTERLPVLGAKLARYAAYFRWATAAGGTAPTLLFVTTTPQREELVRRLAALTLAQFDSLVLTTCAPLLERLGPHAPIWRTSSNEPRATWPLPSSARNPKEVPR
ncbi:MAG: replication-relaxation family protein [Chloroflexi bacterium]|nr:replication-relaxation family protein [Chloroflexota bacterium]